MAHGALCVELYQLCAFPEVTRVGTVKGRQLLNSCLTQYLLLDERIRDGGSPF